MPPTVSPVEEIKRADAGIEVRCAPSMNSSFGPLDRTNWRDRLFVRNIATAGLIFEINGSYLGDVVLEKL